MCRYVFLKYYLLFVWSESLVLNLSKGAKILYLLQEEGFSAIFLVYRGGKDSPRETPRDSHGSIEMC